ncbi:MAG: hypothetical protein P8Y99_13495 [Calditrichaceae bacterium]
MDLSEMTFEDRTEEQYNYETYRYEYGEKTIKTGGLMVGVFVRF